jgi:hypothetical protein
MNVRLEETFEERDSYEDPPLFSIGLMMITGELR